MFIVSNRTMEITIAPKISPLLLFAPHLVLHFSLHSWARKAIVPLLRYNKKFLVQSFAGLGEALD